MTLDELLARLATFSLIDRYMVPDMSDARWPSFRDRPQAFLYEMATREEREAIWRGSEAVIAFVASTRQDYGVARPGSQMAQDGL
jgi:hypothetical protein